jgi:hypothetical protein
MDYLFGSANKLKPAVTGLQVQTSVSTLPIPIVWGHNRVAGNLIWYGDFTASKSSGQGGKGGGGKGAQGWDYHTSFILALAEGPIATVGAVIVDRDTSQSLTSLNLGFHDGSTLQAPWGYLSSKHPGAALGYNGTAYVAASNYDLKSSPDLPDHNFIIGGLLFQTAQAGLPGSGATANATNSSGIITAVTPVALGSGYLASSPPQVVVHDTNGPGGGAVVLPVIVDGGIQSYVIQDGGADYVQPEVSIQWAGDADSALVIQDYLTNPQYGVGYPAGSIDLTTLLSSADAPTIGDSAYQTYCRALGLWLSPALTSQETASSILQRWLRLTNTACFVSGTRLKFVPFGDAAVSGYGVTFVPNLTPVFDLTDDDYVGDATKDPVTVSRTDPSDLYNVIRLEIADAEARYNAKPVECRDQGAVEAYGLRVDSTESAHEITAQSVAQIAGQLILQRQLYVRNSFTFDLSFEYCVLDPMDLVTLTDPGLGLNRTPVRITAIEENDEGTLTITAEEFPLGVASATAYPTQGSNGGQPSTGVIPASVNPPVFFEPDAALLAALGLAPNQPVIAMAVSGGSAGVADPNWGGAEVWVSVDGSTYQHLGTITGPARQGVLVDPLAGFTGTNPDAADTLTVNLAESGGTLMSGSSADAASGRTLCFLDGEFLSYETATLVSGNTYALTGLWRGLFGTSPGAHPTGAAFVRVDDAVETFALPPQYLGVPLLIKLPSFNLTGASPQSLADVTAYAYTPVGTGYGGGAGGVPQVPSGLAANPGGDGEVRLGWAANPAADNVTFYRLYRASGAGAAFASSVPVATLDALGTGDGGLTPGAPYTYFLAAGNAIGVSAPSAGVDATAGTLAELPLAGDVTGPAGANTVVGLQGRPLAASAPADRTVLGWADAAADWAPAALDHGWIADWIIAAVPSLPLVTGTASGPDDTPQPTFILDGDLQCIAVPLA